MLPTPRIFRSWTDQSLAAQFALAGGVVMILSMMIIGHLVAARIEDGVVRNTALATSQYMDSIVSPLSQDLADADELPPGASRALDEVFNNTSLGERVVSYKIWKPGGRIVEASDKTLIGKTFNETENLIAAFQGEVRADFENLHDEEDQGENALGMPLLEIYSPIREVWSGDVIAVVEFYEAAERLQADLREATRNSWFAVALMFLSIGGLLFVIVLRGSRTIDAQRAALTRQLQDLTTMSAHNTALRERVQQAAARASAMNDQALRRIGADLHDGPAQLLGFAALRLDDLRDAVADQGDVNAVERAIKDAMKEVRTISRGLLLPDIENRTPCDIVKGVAETHAARTGTEVAVACDVPGDLDLSEAARICLYRLVQEGLNNAWRYAGGDGQEVELRLRDGILQLWVRDRGPGYPAMIAAAAAADDAPGLGLSGLRDRVESLGGTFETGNRGDGTGAQIHMALDMRTT
jgi:signal transduction histidine kinase